MSATIIDPDDGDRPNEAAEAWEKVRRLEAELQAAHNLAAKVGSLEAELAERDAALAAAHEALRAAHDWLSLFLEHAPIQFGGEEKVDRAISAALSAPALQRAAEELRLLRECEAALRIVHCEAGSHTVQKLGRPYRGGEGMGYVWQVAEAALANLRRFREEKPR